MEKKEKRIVIAATGMILAAFLHKRSKKIREKAKKAGQHVPYGVYEAVVKRPLDVLMSGIALVLLSPVMGVVALSVYIRLGPPILFRQQRPGLDGKIFTIYKFRTMTDEKGRDGELLSDGQRLTGFGKWLRGSSLDELPELLNILKGDMGIVGPRPLMVEYLPRYNEWQKRRHDVRPGLTGQAQVSGRNAISWEEKFAEDINYVGHITFLKDFRIILKTIGMVWKKTGIHSDTAVTMEEFMGNG